MGSKICPDYCGVHVSRFELYTGMHPALSICYEVVTVFQRLGLARLQWAALFPTHLRILCNQCIHIGMLGWIVFSLHVCYS